MKRRSFLASTLLGGATLTTATSIRAAGSLAGETPTVTPNGMKSGSAGGAGSAIGSGAEIGQAGQPAAAQDFGTLYDVIKRESTDVDLYRFLYAMPKAGDIHHHLGGGFLARRWYAVATDRGRNGGQN